MSLVIFFVDTGQLTGPMAQLCEPALRSNAKTATKDVRR